HVGPAVRHPLEFVVALEEVEIGDAVCVGGLSGAQWWSHESEQDLDAVGLERACQFERVGPNATDGVGCHENASWCLRHGVHVCRNSLCTWAGSVPPAV